MFIILLINIFLFSFCLCNDTLSEASLDITNLLKPITLTSIKNKYVFLPSDAYSLFFNVSNETPYCLYGKLITNVETISERDYFYFNQNNKFIYELSYFNLSLCYPKILVKELTKCTNHFNSCQEKIKCSFSFFTFFKSLSCFFHNFKIIVCQIYVATRFYFFIYAFVTIFIFMIQFIIGICKYKKYKLLFY